MHAHLRTPTYVYHGADRPPEPVAFNQSAAPATATVSPGELVQCCEENSFANMFVETTCLPGNNTLCTGFDAVGCLHADYDRCLLYTSDAADE